MPPSHHRLSSPTRSSANLQAHALLWLALALGSPVTLSRAATDPASIPKPRHLADIRARFAPLPSLPPDAANSPAATLGRALFWDRRLSANGSIACASCHLASDAGSDRRPKSIDARDQPTARHSQTVFNAMLQPSLRWTADRTSGARQAERSLTGSMGFTNAAALPPLLEQHGYEPAFKKAFPADTQPLTPSNYALALEAYQATLITPAPIDRFLAGDDNALSPEELRGLHVFIDKGCVDCHRGPLFGGSGLRKFGVFRDYWTATGSKVPDVGLFESSALPSDRHVFRIAMLRNIARTGPYFHDGSVASLREAVQVMADVQLGTRLADTDADAVVAFLQSLSGSNPPHFAPPPAGSPGPDAGR